MSPVKGKRKRVQISDIFINGDEKKRSKLTNENSNGDEKKSSKLTSENSNGKHELNNKIGEILLNNGDLQLNGMVDSTSNEENGSEHLLKVNGNCIEKQLDGPVNSGEIDTKALQSFHAKFTKSENSSQNEQCNTKRNTCFACKTKDDNVVKCPLSSCEKYYHSKCLEKLPTSKIESNNACPLHLCLSCYNNKSKNGHGQLSKGSLYKCFKCPTAFHSKDECHIPGSIILTHEVMSCPDHFSPEKHREYPAVMNLLFCVQCGCNTDLTYCEYCPYSAHKDCIKDGSFVADKYICSRCESRQIIVYNDIVWAKICNFRWWPARVVNPKELPPEMHKIKHFEGEFPVKFFETGEYYWTQKGRVFPFSFKNIGFEDDNVKNHNFKKQMQDIVFDSAINLARQAIKDKTLMKQIESSTSKKPPPYKHIKTNRPIGNVQIYTASDESDYTKCGCKPDDPDPCGYDTICLNRSMCAECLADVCEAGDRCQNQKFQKREYAPVKPFYTENRGWGLKSLEDIKQGHFVIEYVGDLIDEEECERRIEEKQAIGDNNFYFCILDSTRIIDAGPKGNFSRFLNHSCDPNCETQKWIVNGDARVGLFAKKDIPAGSELTFDYQMDFSHFEKLKCNCGSKRCSGLIGKKPHNSRSPSVSPKKPDEMNGTCIKPSNKKNENETTKKDNKPVCFKCKTGGKMMTCTKDNCGKFFHLRCITNVMASKPSSKKWVCPLHFCKKCKSSSDYQCFTCPNAFCKEHVDDTLTKNEPFACPKHSKKL